MHVATGIPLVPDPLTPGGQWLRLAPGKTSIITDSRECWSTTDTAVDILRRCIQTKSGFLGPPAIGVRTFETTMGRCALQHICILIAAMCEGVTCTAGARGVHAKTLTAMGGRIISLTLPLRDGWRTVHSLILRLLPPPPTLKIQDKKMGTKKSSLISGSYGHSVAQWYEPNSP